MVTAGLQRGNRLTASHLISTVWQTEATKHSNLGAKTTMKTLKWELGQNSKHSASPDEKKKRQLYHLSALTDKPINQSVSQSVRLLEDAANYEPMIVVRRLEYELSIQSTTCNYTSA